MGVEERASVGKVFNNPGFHVLVTEEERALLTEKEKRQVYINEIVDNLAESATSLQVDTTSTELVGPIKYIYRGNAKAYIMPYLPSSLLLYIAEVSEENAIKTSLTLFSNATFHMAYPGNQDVSEFGSNEFGTSKSDRDKYASKGLIPYQGLLEEFTTTHLAHIATWTGEMRNELQVPDVGETSGGEQLL